MGGDGRGGIIRGIVRVGKGLGVVHDDTKDKKSNEGNK